MRSRPAARWCGTDRSARSKRRRSMPRRSRWHKTAAALTQDGSLVSVAGGGDTVAALNHAGVAGDFTFVSTAGGAFLEWMEGRVLPGVAALKPLMVEFLHLFATPVIIDELDDATSLNAALEPAILAQRIATPVCAYRTGADGSPNAICRDGRATPAGSWFNMRRVSPMPTRFPPKAAPSTGQSIFGPTPVTAGISTCRTCMAALSGPPSTMCESAKRKEANWSFMIRACLRSGCTRPN